jgi:hypothetical protein
VSMACKQFMPGSRTGPHLGNYVRLCFAFYDQEFIELVREVLRNSSLWCGKLLLTCVSRVGNVLEKPLHTCCN